MSYTEAKAARVCAAIAAAGHDAAGHAEAAAIAAAEYGDYTPMPASWVGEVLGTHLEGRVSYCYAHVITDDVAVVAWVSLLDGMWCADAESWTWRGDGYHYDGCAWQGGGDSPLEAIEWMRADAYASIWR